MSADVRLAVPGDEHSQVASPNGVSLLYADGLVIQLRLVGDCWRAIVVSPDRIRAVPRASENGDWL